MFDALDLPKSGSIETRFGFVALVGCPNAGKSTLMNACIGQKIAGVSAKPQTTRNRIVGLIQGDRTQIALLDTPGFLRFEKSAQHSRLSSYMNREAWGSVTAADVVCYLVDATKGITERDRAFLKDLMKTCGPKLRVVLTKVDKLTKDLRRQILAESQSVALELWQEHGQEGAQGGSSARDCFTSPVVVDMVSAKIPEEVDSFIGRLSALMPAGPHHFSSKSVTDRSPFFVVSEMIREQIFRGLGQELPYGVGVKTEAIEQRKGGTRYVSAAIIVPKDAHKAMIIGKGGAKLREMGSQARASLETYFGQKVFLELFVKVSPGWLASEAGIVDVQGPLSEV
jgi:GTP-binding protein Era